MISKTLKVPSHITILADRNAELVMKGSERKKRNDFLLTNNDPENGNTDITIVGGIWNGNNQAPENAKPDILDTAGYSGALLNFVNVEHLTLENMVLSNSVTYYVRMSHIRYFSIQNIDFFSDQFGVNQDGLHFGGDCRHGTVRNIRALSSGQPNDDVIALNADDSLERVENLDLCRDTIEDILFENIYAKNCHTIIRLLSVHAVIQNIRFRNIHGGFRCYAMNADAARYCRTPLFSESDVPQGVGNIRHITIENFHCYPVLHLPKNFGGTQSHPHTALMIESLMDDVEINDFHYHDFSDSTAICPALSAANVKNIAISADGAEHWMAEKTDRLVLENFRHLKITMPKMAFANPKENL